MEKKIFIVEQEFYLISKPFHHKIVPTFVHFSFLEVQIPTDLYEFMHNHESFKYSTEILGHVNMEAAFIQITFLLKQLISIQCQNITN